MQLLSLSIALVYATAAVLAVKVPEGGTCSQSNNHLSEETYQFTSDCSPSTYCATNSTCVRRGCRRDEYPFGYPPYSDDLPKRCDIGEFCPDEEDACQPLLEVGSLCQLNRDDECGPPPNWQELASPKNHNGTLCLNYRCTYANVTLGNPCIVENTPYFAYAAGTGDQFINVVSRGNCVTGLYCDAVQLQCLVAKQLGDSCTADKECASDNCNQNSVCGVSADSPKHLPSYIYAIISICIILIISGTLGALFMLHKRHRAEEREKRAQYWREQEQFRQNILQMREQARSSLLSLPWKGEPQSPRAADYPPSESSQTGMMYAASQPSGLRNDLSDMLYDDDRENGSMEEALVMKSAPQGVGGRRTSKRS